MHGKRESTEGASAMSTHNAVWSRELVDVVVASFLTFDAGLNTVAFTLDLREGEIDFGSNARNIEASDI